MNSEAVTFAIDDHTGVVCRIAFDSGLGVFIDADGQAIGTFELEGFDGRSRGAITRSGAQPLRFEVRYSRDARGNHVAVGTIDGQAFSIRTAPDHEVLARSAPVAVEPLTGLLLKSLARLAPPAHPGRPSAAAADPRGDYAAALLATIAFVAAPRGGGRFLPALATSWACHRVPGSPSA